MEFGDLRPILSGLAGGLIAVWLCTALARWIPEVCNGKRVETLIVEYSAAILCANVLLSLGLVAALTLYGMQAVAKNDWRALGLGIGGGSFAAMVALALFATFRGAALKEAYVAYAVSQKAPLFLVYGILICCIASFFVALSSF